jgi:trk system potassium uptake protein
VHVVVVGCGRVGSELAGELERQGNTVAVVDKRAEAFRRLPTGFAGYRIVGFGFDRDTLIDAGVEQASALAAVTSGDNSNIMTARVGRETFGVSRVVARIYDPRRAEIYQRLGIPTVATVSWTTDQVLRRLVPERRPTEWTDGTGNIVLVERNLPAAWAGKTFGQLAENGGFTIVAVTRTATAKLAEPSMVGQQDDILHVAVESARIDEFDARLSETQSVGGH